jgi:hypothetical protein
MEKMLRTIGVIVGLMLLLWFMFGTGKRPEFPSTQTAAAAPEFELIIGPRPGSRDDGMTGTHALRTKAITLPDGRSLIVGCVPCLNELTYIVVMNGHAYAVNGYAQDLAKRYSVRSGGKTMAVHDLEQDDSSEAIVDQTPVLAGIESIDECNLPMHNGIVNTIAEAVLGDRCLSKLSLKP